MRLKLRLFFFQGFWFCFLFFKVFHSEDDILNILLFLLLIILILFRKQKTYTYPFPFSTAQIIKWRL